MERACASDFDSFRDAARELIRRGVAPADVTWVDPSSVQAELFGAEARREPPRSDAPELRVPRRYAELAQLAVLYRAPDRFALPYRVLHRLQRGEPKLLEDVLDSDVRELTRRSTAVRRDEHRMHAFVRFRRTEVEGEEQFIAWYAPQHLTLRLGAPFFARRFASQRFAILTPDESAFWDLERLSYGPGAPSEAAPSDDALEELFRTYYRATYNPARRNPELFAHHVPAAFRRHMPELTPDAAAPRGRAVPVLPVEVAEPPRGASLAQLGEAVRACTACPLHAPATQAVPGRGRVDAAICLVGEQPGDEEDRRGQPFIGPAGHVLDRALEQAQLDRGQLYLTNAVKHFNFRLEGKKRLHAKPQQRHVMACKPWLQAELDRIKPRVVVCLGATAAQALFGKHFRVSEQRGQLLASPWGGACIATYHPSAVLRADTDEHADELFAALVTDLRMARALVHGKPR